MPSGHNDTGTVRAPGRWAQAAIDSVRNGPRSIMFSVTRNKLQKSATTKFQASSARPEYTLVGTYNGDWSADVRHGFGAQTYSDGTKYEGFWESDKKTGKGTLYKLRIPTGPDGKPTKGKPAQYNKVYSGSWVQNRKEGHGAMSYEEGGSYDGHFTADLRHGYGTQLYPDGSKYVGEWSNDKRHGHGTLTLANGDSYIGCWADDLKHGPGRFIYASRRTVYDGEWSLDCVRCGEMRLLQGDTGAEQLQEGAMASLVLPRRGDDLPLPPLALAEPAAVLQRATRTVRASTAALLAGEGRDGPFAVLATQSTGSLVSGPSSADSGVHFSPAASFLSSSSQVPPTAEHHHADPFTVNLASVGLTAEELRHLRDAFSVADPGSSGYIPSTIATLAEVLSMLGITPDAADTEILCEQLCAAQAEEEVDGAVAAGATGDAIERVVADRAATQSLLSSDKIGRNPTLASAQSGVGELSFRVFVSIMAGLKE